MKFIKSIKGLKLLRALTVFNRILAVLAYIPLVIILPFLGMAFDSPMTSFEQTKYVLYIMAVYISPLTSYIFSNESAIYLKGLITDYKEGEDIKFDKKYATYLAVSGVITTVILFVAGYIALALEILSR